MIMDGNPRMNLASFVTTYMVKKKKEAHPSDPGTLASALSSFSPTRRCPGPLLTCTMQEKECEALMLDAARKNYVGFAASPVWCKGEIASSLRRDFFPTKQIDIDEYPQTYEMQKRCVNMLARLWNAPLAAEEGA